LPGVIRTRVGYCGGTTPHPTYHALGDHTESFQVDYDPRVITYADLLSVFWASHDPHAQAYSTQYKAIAFYNDDDERVLVEEAKRAIEQRDQQPVATEVRPLTLFHRAEDYHQKYYLRGEPELLRELRGMFPSAQAFADSTLAARLNAYAGGHGFKAVLERELTSYGLSMDAQEFVRRLAAGLDEGAGGGAACGLVSHSTP
jgi:peptide-methionine (S)-S-oxide reductase